MTQNSLSATPPREKLAGADETSTPKVRCAECLKQLPADRAVKSETQDYIRHFCGLDCLHEWERKRHAR